MTSDSLIPFSAAKFLAKGEAKIFLESSFDADDGERGAEAGGFGAGEVFSTACFGASSAIAELVASAIGLNEANFSISSLFSAKTQMG